MTRRALVKRLERAAIRWRNAGNHQRNPRNNWHNQDCKLCRAEIALVKAVDALAAHERGRKG